MPTRRVIAASLFLTLAILGALQVLPGEEVGVHSGLATPAFVQSEFRGVPYLLYVPASLPTDKPATVFVTVHGMGAQADQFASGFVPDAERNGWVMVVPHFPYGDWTQTEVIKKEERRQLDWLHSLLGALPDETGLNLSERVLLYGFSRGGQFAHRFALAYPENVAAAAIMSPGSYTLPVEHSAAYDDHAPLYFPVGVDDLSDYCGRSFDSEAVNDIPFWIGVGEKDNTPGDVPRLYDKYEGNTRVDRARAFAASLKGIGASVALAVFPGLGHAESVDSRGQAVAFLEQNEKLVDGTVLSSRSDWTMSTLQWNVKELQEAGLGLDHFN